MITSETNTRPLLAKKIEVTEDSLIADLSDGRSIIVPLAWYPRLLNGTPQEKSNWRFIGRGEGIHWPNLDEDIRVADLIAGKSSGESQRSFKRWLAKRNALVEEGES